MRMSFVFVVFIIVILVPILYISSQDSQIIEGAIQQKRHEEKQCTEEIAFDPALSMYLPKENCEGPYWIITINNREYHVSEQLFNKLDIDSYYSFSYHPFSGLKLLNE